MYPDHHHDTTHRHPTEDPLTLPGLTTQAALVAAPPLALWAVTNPTAALLAVTLLAALAWHRLGARPRPRPRATPPD